MSTVQSTLNRINDSNLSTPAILIAILVALDGFVWWLNIPFVEDIFTVATITLIMVLGFQMFMGNSGILSWSYVGFVGIGAFVSAILSTPVEYKAVQYRFMYQVLVDVHLPFVPALICGGLFAALVAAIVSWPMMRLTDSVGAIAQFSLLIVIHVLLAQWGEVTNGPRTFTLGTTRITNIWIALFVAVLVIIVAYSFKESSLGLKLRASRDDRHAARSSGINIIAVRYYSYIASAFIGGIAGGLYSHYIMSITASAFYMNSLFVLLTMSVIGGSMSISGVFFGTLLVTFVQKGLQQLEFILSRDWHLEASGTTDIVLSLLMIAFLILMPNGISSGRELNLKALTGLRRRRKGEIQ